MGGGADFVVVMFLLRDCASHAGMLGWVYGVFWHMAGHGSRWRWHE